jgi:hypothetical protein
VHEMIEVMGVLVGAILFMGLGWWGFWRVYLDPHEGVSAGAREAEPRWLTHLLSGGRTVRVCLALVLVAILVYVMGFKEFVPYSVLFP